MSFVHQHRRENQNEKAESRGIRGPAGPWAASTANATIVTVFNNWTDGLTNFNSKIAGAGGTATHDNWASLYFSNGDTKLDSTGYKLTRTDGSALSDQGIYYAYGSSPTANTTGSTIDIDPYGNSTDNGHGDTTASLQGQRLRGGRLGHVLPRVGPLHFLRQQRPIRVG